MALTLSPELLAAQTAQSRRPIIEVTAGRMQADYPFVGNDIANTIQKDQGASCSLILPSGALMIIYAAGSLAFPDPRKELHCVVSDAGVTEFSAPVVIDANYLLKEITDIDAVILSTGNIGVAVQYSTDAIVLYTISPSGSLVHETAITGLSVLDGVSVCRSETGCLLAYTQYATGSYAIRYRTSTDFATWSSATAFSIPGLAGEQEICDVAIRRLLDGSFLLVFAQSAGSIFNLYSSTSSDLSTWSTPVAVTSTAEISRDYSNPSVVQKSDGTVVVASQRTDSYLEMECSDAGWNALCVDTGDTVCPRAIWVDEANAKVYLVASKPLYPATGVVKIDIPSWSVEKIYGPSTDPGFPPLFDGAMADFTGAYGAKSSVNDGVAIIAAGQCAFCVVDFSNDDIRGYYFVDQSNVFGATAAKNVLYDDTTHLNVDYAGSLYKDNRVWLAISYTSFVEETSSYIQSVSCGYIDFAQVTPPFEFVEVNSGGGLPVWAGHEWVQFYPEINLALVGFDTIGAVDHRNAELQVFSLAEDAYIKRYRNQDYTNFPRYGVLHGVVVDATYIFAIPAWRSDGYAAEEHKWGLIRINTLNDTMDYFYPPWEVEPGNYYTQIVENTGDEEVILQSRYGVVVFNYVSETWERFENNEPGAILPPTLVQGWGQFAYDSTRELFFYGTSDLSSRFNLVPRSGAVSSIVYQEGDIDALPEPSMLSIGYSNAAPSVAVDENDIAYASWTNTGEAPDQVQWDKASARIDLFPYLTGETKLGWDMDGPGAVTFSLSHGHLFDQHNVNSILKAYIGKGKGITVKMGELIGGNEVVVDQGVFVVTGTSVRHSANEYPLINVTAEDAKYLWGLHQITACQVDSVSPETALVDLIAENSAIIEQNIIVPSMPLSFVFDSQWIDQTLKDIVDDIAHRFQYFSIIGMDGKVYFRPIVFSGDSILTIPVASIISCSPNDDNSDLTNRITVTGEGVEDMEITYEEEKITSINGTVGWYGYKNDFRIDYSEDKTARYKEPRLEVVESATGILFKLAGKIKERISEVDPDNKYCVVKVESPNLIPILVAAIGLYAAGNMVGDLTMSFGGGMTIPVGRKMEGVGVMLALMVLGSTGNFQFNIHGRPVGYVKRSYQASADDEALQQELGQVVESKIEGFLCHTPAQCQAVADFEMAVAVAERRKMTVEMISHLQIEVGDIATVTHPYTKLPVKLFVTNLSRAYKPASSGDSDGYVKDTIEGWVL